MEIIVCRSSLAALTSGRVPLCGATNRVVLKIPCRCGAARSVRYMLVHVCGALRHPHSSAQPGWWADQTGGWRERQASNNSCRSDPGRWTKQLLNREFSFFFPSKKIILHFLSEAGQMARQRRAFGCRPEHLLPFRAAA